MGRIAAPVMRSIEVADYQHLEDRQLIHRIGLLEVDDRGWGTAWFQPGESLFKFERVELTAAKEGTSVPGTQVMVLEGTIPFPRPTQIPNLR